MARSKLVGLAAMVLAFACARTAGAVGEEISGFPNWSERVIHEWMNRARAAPSVEMQTCGVNTCPDGACYQPVAPLVWDEKLNHAARFHSAELTQQMYFAHDSACTLVANIATIYPGQCNGAASCACQGGVKQCMGQCTSWSQRVGLFGVSAAGEIIASPADPNQAFYLWLYEPFNKSACAFDFGPPTNGHRWNILKSGPKVGVGVTTADAVGDFGGSGGAIPKIPSGSHYPRQSGSVGVWANWYDNAGPQSALVNVDGTCAAMQLGRGAVTNGAYTATLANVASGCHRYFFLFKDSQANIVTYPTTGSLGIGPANSCADWDSSRPPTGMGCSCTPQCQGKVCGDDGCGGSCGNCGANQTCQSGQCVGGAMDGGAGADGGNPGADGGGNPGADGGGNPGADGGGNPGADGGGNPADPNNPNGASGCGCSSAPSSTDGAWAALALAIGLTIRKRRREASRRRRPA